MIKRARRRAGRAALRPGAHRAVDQTDRRRREQLAVLRHHRPLQAGPLLHPDRAHDGARGAGDVAARLGRALARRTQTIFARPRATRASSCASCGASWRSARGSRREAGRHHDHYATSTASRSRHAMARSTPRRRPIRRLRQLIERIRAGPVSFRSVSPSVTNSRQRHDRPRRKPRPSGSNARARACRSAGALLADRARSNSRRRDRRSAWLIWNGAQHARRRLGRASAQVRESDKRPGPCSRARPAGCRT